MLLALRACQRAWARSLQVCFVPSGGIALSEGGIEARGLTSFVALSCSDASGAKYVARLVSHDRLGQRDLDVIAWSF